MTAEARPLLTAEQATILLERVLLEQVMAQVDLEGLFGVRSSLASAIAELAPRARDAAKGAVDEPSFAGRGSAAEWQRGVIDRTLAEAAAELASDAAIDAQIEAMTDEMMTRALQRLAEQALRYLRAAVELDDDDCPLCEDTACNESACSVPAGFEIVRPHAKAASARTASRGPR